MLSIGKKEVKEGGQQSVAEPKNSKAFTKITIAALVLYVVMLSLLITIFWSDNTKGVNEITNIIFILSPLLFTIFLKELYKYLITREEYYNGSRSKKELDYEDKSLTSLLSAMAVVPIVFSLFLSSIFNLELSKFFVVLVILALIASILYYFFIYDMFPTDEPNE